MSRKSDERVRRRLAESVRALAENRARDALDAASAVMRERPQLPEARLYAGFALVRLGERGPGVLFIEEAARLGPRDAEVQAGAGQAFAELDRPSDAEACFRRACAADLRAFPPRFALAVMLERRGAWEEAEESYRLAIDLRPEAAPAWVGLGNAERAQGRDEEARASYRRATEADPAHAPAWNNLGNLEREGRRTGEAEAAYRTAVEHAPRYAPGWTNLASLLGAAGRREEEAEAWRRASELAPRDVDVWSGLGSALERTGRAAEAIPAFERALACVTPDHPRVISALGRLHAALALAHLRAGGADGAEALAACDAWLGRRPGDATGLAAKAILLHHLGREEESRSLSDAGRLAARFRIDPTPDYPDLERFNEALARHVAGHPSLAWAPPHNATRDGQHSGELVTEPTGPAVVLKTRILDCIERYAASIAEAEPDHLVVRHRPPAARMRMWGVVMRAGGHQISHIHPAAWLSGVYYPEVPDFVSADDPGRRGWIEFGRAPEEEFPDVKPMPVEAIRPEEGLLLIFPAWLYHRTVPYPADLRRISVAFDLVPADAPDFRRLLGPGGGSGFGT